MKQRDPKETFFYNEHEVEEVSSQIMGAYINGVVDSPDGQVFHNDGENEYS